MIKFPLVILRRKAVQAIHDRSRALDKKNRDLVDENNSLNMVVKRRDQQIELLKDKCSRVGLSKLENQVSAKDTWIKTAMKCMCVYCLETLGRKLGDEKMPDTKLPQSDGTIAPVLSNALVQDTAGKAPGDIGHAEGPHTGSLQKVLGLEVPGSHLA